MLFYMSSSFYILDINSESIRSNQILIKKFLTVNLNPIDQDLIAKKFAWLNISGLLTERVAKNYLTGNLFFHKI